MRRKKRGEYLCWPWIVMTSLLFELKFTFDFSNAGGAHVYELYVSEVLCIGMSVTVLSKLLNGKKTTGYRSFLLMLYIGISLYYVALTAVRVWNGVHYADSMWLFRDLFCAFSLSLYAMEDQKHSPDQYRTFLILFFGVVSLGYVVNMIRTRTFAPNFPNYSLTYLVFGMMLYPYFMCDAMVRPDTMGPGWRALLSADRLVIIVTCLLSGSRAVFWLMLFEIGLICLAARFDRQKFFLLASGAAFILTFYQSNLFLCRDSIHRSLGLKITQAELTHPEQVIENAMGVREAIAATGGVQNIEYHNPADLSNAVRVVLLRKAEEELRGDSLFHMGGKSGLEFEQGGQTQISGTHNFLVDYTLAFGTFGTLLILCYVGGIVCSTIQKLNKRGGRGCLICYLTSVGSIFAIGMVQAILSDRIVLGFVLSFLSMVWIQYDSEERDNETDLIKKRNHLYSRGIGAPDRAGYAPGEN